MHKESGKRARWLAAVFMVLLAGCAGEISEAVLSVVPGSNWPCLGVQRLKVTVFRDEISGKAREVYGEFYQPDGSCKLQAGLPFSLTGLAYTGNMSVLVEGFDSSEKRRLCTGRLESIGREAVQSGDLGQLTLERIPVDDGGTPRYPKGTLVISPLPGIDQLGAVEYLTFNCNHFLIDGDPRKFSGRFRTDPATPLAATKLVLSNLMPSNPLEGNLLIVVAYRQYVAVGQWKNSSAFVIGEEDVFVEVPMSAEHLQP